MSQITIFKDIHNTTTPFFVSIDKALERIKEGLSKELVKEIRSKDNKKDRNELKKGLPAICFSGKFSKRGDDYITEHSGFICLDFDGYANQESMLADKEMMKKDQYVYSVFLSPSGNGLKTLIRIPPDADNHIKYFNALEKHFNSEHFDKTSKNVSRVCYESFDPLIYINENSQLWDTLDESEYKEHSVNSETKIIPIKDENKIIDILIKWWEKKYPMVEGQRNQNVYILAVAFNEFGVNKSLASYFFSQFAEQGFSEKEIATTIESAYRDTSKFGSKQYEDTDRMDSVRSKVAYGKTAQEIKDHPEFVDVEPEVIDGIVEDINDSNAPTIFWSTNERSGAVSVNTMLFKYFLVNNGYHKYRVGMGNKALIFIKVENNLVIEVSENQIKDFVLDYIESLEMTNVYNYFANSTKLFKEDYLTMLPTLDIYFVKDTHDAAYLYYKNAALRVTKNEIKAIDYIDLGGYVWKNQVIDRNFKVLDDKEAVKQSIFSQFIKNVCNQDNSRIAGTESAIGYLLHTFKTEAKSPSIILNDEVISDNPEGGTGKGIFMKAIGHIRRSATIDGKSFSTDKSFPYQTVSADTQILIFDDVYKNFPFEKLFSVITEGITLEKKNAHAIKLSFRDSPKIAITTNYAIRGAGNSFKRRKFELEFFQHYNDSHTPEDDFGKMLFMDFSETEWNEFDNYMINCLQNYLSKGLITPHFVNLKKRQLSAETCHEFIEWCGLINNTENNDKLALGRRIYANNLYNDFVEKYPDFAPRAKMSLSQIRFNRWVESYFKYATGLKPLKGKDRFGTWYEAELLEFE